MPLFQHLFWPSHTQCQPKLLSALFVHWQALAGHKTSSYRFQVQVLGGFYMIDGVPAICLSAINYIADYKLYRTNHFT